MLHFNTCISIQYWNTYITNATSLILTHQLLCIIFLLISLLCYSPILSPCFCKTKVLALFLPFSIADIIYTVYLCYLGQHHQIPSHAWQSAKNWSQLCICHYRPSPNKKPMLSSQSLHCISAPANEGVLLICKNRVRSHIWLWFGARISCIKNCSTNELPWLFPCHWYQWQ